MKRILIVALSALLYVLSAVAQENFYFINGKHVADFNGSQLVGMQIKFYEMKRTEHVIFHNIFTTDSPIKIDDGPDSIGTLSMTVQSSYNTDNGSYTIVGHSSGSISTTTTSKMRLGTMSGPLIILDGEIFKGRMNEIDQTRIKSMNVYKPGSEVALTYNEMGTNGVIEIFTQSLPDDIIYYINGRLAAAKEALKSLSPERIKRVTVLKRGSAAAINACPEGKTNDIYQITTK